MENVFLEEKIRECKRIWIKTPEYHRSKIKRLISQLVFAYRTIKLGLKKDRPDIIIGSSVHLFAGLAAYILAKKKNVPFVFEVRDLWPQTLVDLGYLKKRSIVTYCFRWLEKFLYKKADKIVSVLPKGENYISSLGIKKEKVVHIPNGVDLNWFDEAYDEKIKNEQLKDFFSNQNKDVFVYTGAHGVSNGLETVIDAANIIQKKGIDDIQLLLVGDGPKKDELEKKAKNLKLNNITFIDRVNKDQVPVILKKSDACIAIRIKNKVHKYGVSMNKIFEYLASKNPMISAIDAPHDFAEKSNSGISIPPSSPEKLASAIIKISKMSLQERGNATTI